MVGKFKNEAVGGVFATYVRRARRYFDVDIVEVKKGRYKKPCSVRSALKKEKEYIRRKTGDESFEIVLDEHGEQITTVQFVDLLENLKRRGVHSIKFFIGGPYGFDEELKEEADLTLAFSKMTVPHELARLLLIEQLYRCGTILSGEKYHK